MRVWPTLRLAASTFAAILCATAGSATVIDFDDISDVVDRDAFPFLGIDPTYHGHTWQSPGEYQHWGVVQNTDWEFGSVGARSGAQAAWNWGGAHVQDVLFAGPQFVQGAYFNVFASDVPWSASTVQLIGYDGLGSVVATSAVLELDTAGDWRWLSLGAGGVSRLSIVATSSQDPEGAWWAMDDLALGEQVAVPEPSPVWLLFAAAVFIARLSVIHRRRV